LPAASVDSSQIRTGLALVHDLLREALLLEVSGPWRFLLGEERDPLTVGTVVRHDVRRETDDPALSPPPTGIT
jgi:hypothetical protein